MFKDNPNIVFWCLVCFARENDVVLRQKDDENYYCIKCSFQGNENDILRSYQHLKEKYKNIAK
ncbi:MAG: hypothetical protein RR444_10535 [Oscillospiraceae bacterium]